MTQALSHRGPDADGLWQDPECGLLLGHRRLSIIDLSAEGAQPMVSASERYVLAYNGEIYNFQALRKQLELEGVNFRGHSDTEVLLALIEKDGFEQSLEKISGMFAFALWDRKNRMLHFARDHMGKKPLYIGWAGGTLVFGSELKALRAHPDFEAIPDQRAVAAFMHYGYVPAPLGIYQNVWQLPPAHALSLSIDRIESQTSLPEQMRPYWYAEQAVMDARNNPLAGSLKENVHEFESILSACVQSRMISDVPLGAFLSGGIDSSSIVALMQKHSPQKIKTYTIGFDENGFDEAAYAKKIAAHIGTDHHELYLNARDALDVIPALPDLYDEPFADISAIPTFLVSKFARESVTVALSGDGGDEMLGGYNRHVQGPALWRRMQMIPAPLRKSMTGFIQKHPPEKWNRLMPRRPGFGLHLHKLACALSASSQGELYESFLAQWPEPPTRVALEAIPQPPFMTQNPDLSFTERMMLADTLFYLPHDILTKVDRASMAVSLEVRAPLLDKRIFEYAWRLPANQKIRGGQGKYILRQILERHIPANLFERPKQGFSMPVGAWLRTDLRDWAEELLNERTLKEQGYLNAGLIRHIWNDHLQGRNDHGTKLWIVLMFQAWLKKWG